MSKICYEYKRFNADHTEILRRADALCVDYARRGYSLTLRQLYYQFVARDWLPNIPQSYKKLGNVINDGRLAGEIDWSHITDRTRNLQRLSTWGSPGDIIEGAAQGYRTDRWIRQANYVEVWVEKEALADVVSRPADRWQVPYFACRGYVSQSEMWAAAMRIKRRERDGKVATLLHLGDHDPSGIDMTRDIRDRMALFGCGVNVVRLALNMDQVEEYQPPPNPAKLTDSRASEYVEIYGDESWELDALPPEVLDVLIDENIQSRLDLSDWQVDTFAMEEERAGLNAASAHWQEVFDHMDGQGWVERPEQEPADYEDDEYHLGEDDE